jgi:hypothetical protein
MINIAIIPLYVPAVAQAGTEYTAHEDRKRISFQRATGNVALYLVSTAGQITISQQVSLDGEAWYDPEDSNGAALGVVVTNQPVTTGKYIVFTPVMAPYIRFKIVEQDVAASTVTAKLLMQE